MTTVCPGSSRQPALGQGRRCGRTPLVASSRPPESEPPYRIGVGTSRPSLEVRVVRAAEAALAEQSYVSPIDVLIGVGWLTPQAVDLWRQGRAEDLERVARPAHHGGAGARVPGLCRP